MDKELTFKVTVEQANIIKQALMELPFKVSASVIVELDRQAEIQLREDDVHKD